MGTWGVGIYQNDDALDWIADGEGIQDFIEHIHDRWDELRIIFYVKDDEPKVVFDLDLKSSIYNQLIYLEESILVWCDIVTKHKVPIYGYEWYSTLKALESCRSYTIWLYNWDDDEWEQRIEIFDDLIRKLREHGKNGYIIQGEED
jgi:hypothetical protein